MGLSEELKIVISGDPDKFNKALDEVSESTKRLEAGLKSAAEISGIAFAALTATVGELVSAYRDQEIQEQKTAALIRATGGAAQVTAVEVKELAESFSQVSLFSRTAIQASENIILGFSKIGGDVFPKAQKAALDLAAFLGGDLSNAAFVLSKALQEPELGLQALGRVGIKFTQGQQDQIKALAENGQLQKAQALILGEVEKRYGGLAQAQTEGTGSLILMKNAFEDLSQNLGKELAPALEKVASYVTPVVKALSENQEFLKTAAAVLSIGVAITGLVTAASLAALTFVKVINIAKAAKLAFLELELSISGVVGATGIGLLLLVITDLALNWNKRTLQISSAWKAFISTVVEGAAGLNDVLFGLATGNLEKINSGFNQLKDAGKSFFTTYNKLVDEGLKAQQESEDKANETKKKGAIKYHEDVITTETVFLEQRKKLIDQKNKEIAELGLSAGQQEVLQRLEINNQIMAAEKALIKERRLALQDANSIDAQQQLDFETKLQQIENQKRSADINKHRAYLLEKAQIKAKSDLQYIKDEEKFGKAYAKLNQILNSTQLQGASQAASDLVALQNSKNDTLKGIGKAAAVAQITIDTATSAMNIFNGFSTIPIVGYALGIVGAAAAVAFGAERIGDVLGAANGGIITGGIPGKDSVPAFLAPGELVAPAKNFDEVVNSVANARAGIAGGYAQSGGGGSMDVTIGFTDDAFRIIERKLTERKVLGV